MSGRKETCETCRYWSPDGVRESEEGYCLRHAPRPTICADGDERASSAVIWPRTVLDDWCGEWRAAGSELTATGEADSVTRYPVVGETLGQRQRWYREVLYEAAYAKIRQLKWPTGSGKSALKHRAAHSLIDSQPDLTGPEEPPRNADRMAAGIESITLAELRDRMATSRAAELYGFPWDYLSKWCEANGIEPPERKP